MRCAILMKSTALSHPSELTYTAVTSVIKYIVNTCLPSMEMAELHFHRYIEGLLMNVVLS